MFSITEQKLTDLKANAFDTCLSNYPTVISYREDCSSEDEATYKRGCKNLKKDWKTGVKAQINEIKTLEKQLLTEDPSAAAAAGISTSNTSSGQKQERDLCANAEASDLANCQAQEQAYKDLVATCKADRSAAGCDTIKDTVKGIMSNFGYSTAAQSSKPSKAARDYCGSVTDATQLANCQAAQSEVNDLAAVCRKDKTATVNGKDCSQIKDSVKNIMKEYNYVKPAPSNSNSNDNNINSIIKDNVQKENKQKKKSDRLQAVYCENIDNADQDEIDACKEKFDAYLEKKELCTGYLEQQAAGRSVEGLTNPCKEAKVMMKDKPKKGEKIADQSNSSKPVDNKPSPGNNDSTDSSSDASSNNVEDLKQACKEAKNQNKVRGIAGKPQACIDYLEAVKGSDSTESNSTDESSSTTDNSKVTDDSAKKSPCQSHFPDDKKALATCVSNMDACQEAKKNGQTSKQNRHPSCSALKAQIREAMAATSGVSGRALAVDFDIYEYFGF